MAFLPPDKVKQGFWIDWSQGQVFGSTITTTTASANIIVSVLTVVVSLASIHLWHIVLFLFYQSRTNKQVADGLYRQQQALLREHSIAGPGQTIWQFGKLGWTWRGKARNNLLRSSVPVLVAVIFSLIALAATLTSSYIVSSSTITVLVDSDNCGTLGSIPPERFNTYLENTGPESLEYAKNCYLEDLTSACIKYVARKINFTTTPAPCPFSKSICTSSQETDTPGITLDTGYLDSNDDFGLNAIGNDRVQLRKKTTCAPIKVSGYYKTVDVTDYPGPLIRKPFPDEQIFILEYGTQPGGPHGSTVPYGYDSYISNFTRNYNVETRQSGPTYGTTDASYIPIEELSRSDADTVLVWIFSNSIRYRYPTDDPVFSAHQKTTQGFVGLGEETVYKPDHPLGTVACSEQYQYCITNTGGLNCTDLGGLPTLDTVAALGANDNQLATFKLFHKSMFAIDISIIQFNTVLLAETDTAGSGYQDQYIPNDQWKHEVNFWESYVLSFIQNLITSHAIGPKITGNNGKQLNFTTPPTEAGRNLCKSQKMRVKGGFANISVFGLAFTIAIAGVIVITDLLLLKILLFVGKSPKFNKRWSFNVDDWIQDGVLQLQRKAYEASGQGSWTRHDKEIPLVGQDDQLYRLNSADHKSEGRPSSSSTDQPSSSLEDITVTVKDTETEDKPKDGANATSTAVSIGREANFRVSTLASDEAALVSSAVSPV